MINNAVWTKKDGSKIAVNEMNRQYIINCIVLTCVNHTSIKSKVATHLNIDAVTKSDLSTFSTEELKDILTSIINNSFVVKKKIMNTITNTDYKRYVSKSYKKILQNFDKENKKVLMSL